MPLFARIAAEERRPLALVEVGASAGLCLYPDRYAYRWTTDAGDVALPLAAAPELTCRVRGPAPLPDAHPVVGWRAGVDLNPLDVTDPDAGAWLATLVWPEEEARRARLRSAIAVAAADPPDLRAGDLLDALPGLVEEATAYGVPVVFHSAVIAYLEPDDRRRFAELVGRLVGAGACRWVSNEGPSRADGGHRAGAGRPARSGAVRAGPRRARGRLGPRPRRGDDLAHVALTSSALEPGRWGGPSSTDESGCWCRSLHAC